MVNSLGCKVNVLNKTLPKGYEAKVKKELKKELKKIKSPTSSFEVKPKNKFSTKEMGRKKPVSSNVKESKIKLSSSLDKSMKFIEREIEFAQDTKQLFVDLPSLRVGEESLIESMLPKMFGNDDKKVKSMVSVLDRKINGLKNSLLSLGAIKKNADKINEDVIEQVTTQVDKIYDRTRNKISPEIMKVRDTYMEIRTNDIDNIDLRETIGDAIIDVPVSIAQSTVGAPAAMAISTGAYAVKNASRQMIEGMSVGGKSFTQSVHDFDGKEFLDVSKKDTIKSAVNISTTVVGGYAGKAISPLSSKLGSVLKEGSIAQKVLPNIIKDSVVKGVEESYKGFVNEVFKSKDLGKALDAAGDGALNGFYEGVFKSPVDILTNRLSQVSKNNLSKIGGKISRKVKLTLTDQKMLKNIVKDVDKIVHDAVKGEVVTALKNTAVAMSKSETINGLGEQIAGVSENSIKEATQKFITTQGAKSLLLKSNSKEMSDLVEKLLGKVVKELI